MDPFCLSPCVLGVCEEGDLSFCVGRAASHTKGAAPDLIEITKTGLLSPTLRLDKTARSQSTTYCMIPFIGNVHRRQAIHRKWISGLLTGYLDSRLELSVCTTVNGYDGFLGDGNVLKLIVVVIAQVCERTKKLLFLPFKKVVIKKKLSYLAVPGLICSVQTLCCSLWDLVAWPRTEPGPPALGTWTLDHQGSPIFTF